MADKKIIAVVGRHRVRRAAGWCAPSWPTRPAGSPARAITRDAELGQGEGARRAGRRSRGRRRGRRSEPDERRSPGAYGAYCVTFFWDALLAREGKRRRRAAMAEAAQGRRREARHLVDARGHAPVGSAQRRPHADADGPLQGPALRCARARPTPLHRRRRADDVPADVVLLGQLHPLRHGAEEGPGRRARDHAADGRQEAARHRRRRTSAAAPTASSRGATHYIGKSVGIAGEHLTGAEMAAALSKALGQDVRYNDVTPEVYRGFGFPGADDLATCSSSTATSRTMFCAARNLEFSRTLNPGLQTFERGSPKRPGASRSSDGTAELRRSRPRSCRSNTRCRSVPPRHRSVPDHLRESGRSRPDFRLEHKTRLRPPSGPATPGVGTSVKYRFFPCLSRAMPVGCSRLSTSTGRATVPACENHTGRLTRPIQRTLPADNDVGGFRLAATHHLRDAVIEDLDGVVGAGHARTRHFGEVTRRPSCQSICRSADAIPSGLGTVSPSSVIFRITPADLHVQYTSSSRDNARLVGSGSP